MAVSDDDNIQFLDGQKFILKLKRFIPRYV